MKRLGLFLTAMLLTLTIFTPGVQAASYKPPFEVNAQSAYMVNLDSDMIIYEKNKDEKIHPGGLAQIMTVILALESGIDLDNTEITMKNYIQDDMYIKNKELKGIALAGLLRGESISLKNLLYAIMLPGANEAAMMVADYVGDGSVNYFVEQMNRRAKELGANNTNFMSPHGLPDDSYTTAYDIYLITRHAMTLPGFSDMTTITTYNGGPTNKHESLNWHTANKMMIKGHSAYYSPIKGIKSAYSSTTGSSIVSMAQRGGYSYLMVVMGCPTTASDGEPLEQNQAFANTQKLYGWAFETFKIKTLLEKGKNFGEIKLRLAWNRDFIRLMAEDSFTALIPDEIEASSITYKTYLPDYVKAPIKKGDPVGYVDLLLAGEKMGSVRLVSSDEVTAGRLLQTIDGFETMTRTFLFKFFVVLIVVLILMYIGITIYHNKGRRRYSSRH